MTRPDPSDLGRMAQHFEAANRSATRKGLRHFLAVAAAIIIAGAVALTLAVLVHHFITTAAAMIAAPLEGKPW